MGLLLTLGTNIWKARNNYVHENQENQIRPTLHRKLIRLHKMKTQVDERYHKKLFPPIEDLIKMKTKEIENWVRTVQLLITSGDNQQITKYFKPVEDTKYCNSTEVIESISKEEQCVSEINSKPTKEEECSIIQYVNNTKYQKKDSQVNQQQITRFFSRPQPNISNSSTFMRNRIVSEEIKNNIIRKLDDPTLWIGNAIIIKTRRTTYNVGYESFRRLQWDELVPHTSKWLNDEIIAAHLAILGMKEDAKLEIDTNNKCSYFMSTYLVTTLIREGYQGVKKWGRKVAAPRSLLDGKHIFFPININNNHWVLVVAETETRKIKFYDTYHGNEGRYYGELVAEYLRMECDETFVYEEYHYTPPQRDSYSCGVFILAEIEAIIEGAPLDFNEGEMQVTYRQYLAGELIKFWNRRPDRESVEDDSVDVTEVCM